MDLYFCGSVRGGRDDVGLYDDLIRMLEAYGRVLTEHVGIENLESQQAESDDTIHQQDIQWLGQADAVIAEVTRPSLGVGYEVGRAVEQDKPILALYRPDSDQRLSAMLRGSDGVTVEEYHDPTALEPVFESFFDDIE